MLECGRKTRFRCSRQASSWADRDDTGDTRPCENAIGLARHADLLVHEATFAGGLEEKAAAYGHSTFTQSRRNCREAERKRLIVTHFSSRYDDEEVAELTNSVKEIFANIEPAIELSEIASKSFLTNS